MAGENSTAIAQNGWQRERADVLVQLALLSKTVVNIEAQVNSISGRLAGVTQTLAVDEVRREIVAELFHAVEKLELAMPENLRERVQALEKLAPVMRGVVWLAGVLGVSIIALLWAMITGQAVVMFK